MTTNKNTPVTGTIDALSELNDDDVEPMSVAPFTSEICEIVWATSWITGSCVFWAKAVSQSGVYNAGETVWSRTPKNRRLLKHLKEALGQQGWEHIGNVGSEFWQYTFRREVTERHEGPVTVVLQDAGLRKMEAIKVVRGIFGLGLKESYDLVYHPPQPVITNVTRDSALAIAKWL